MRQSFKGDAKALEREKNMSEEKLETIMAQEPKATVKKKVAAKKKIAAKAAKPKATVKKKIAAKVAKPVPMISFKAEKPFQKLVDAKAKQFTRENRSKLIRFAVIHFKPSKADLKKLMASKLAV
jgi:hypothetical protein